MPPAAVTASYVLVALCRWISYSSKPEVDRKLLNHRSLWDTQCSASRIHTQVQEGGSFGVFVAP